MSAPDHMRTDHGEMPEDVMDEDMDAHRRTYRLFVKAFAFIILAHFVAGSFVFLGLFAGAGWAGAAFIAIVEIALIAAVWRAMSRSGGPSGA